ncbi:MAG: S-methyl-5'-thioadenosine phosphorylase [Thermoplasmata archaeon]|nr:MAG: S-methyl-5'-thioadenosine phosphorylase [Thermoplasmata archaeon]
MMRIGIISGHKIREIARGFNDIEIETRYGRVVLSAGRIGKKDVFFLNRHQGDLPPHRINYLANIEALRLAGVKSIISMGTVGSLNPEIEPGMLVIPDDFIDFTKKRISTFFDDSRIHVDMSEPFCPHLRKILIDVCREKGVAFREKGIYLATEGPRLETKAEINLFKGFADVVGMTVFPEVVLAREREMCYSSICLVCNMAAGMQDRLSADEIKRIFMEKEETIADIILEAVKRIDDYDCECRHALKGARL